LSLSARSRPPSVRPLSVRNSAGSGSGGWVMDSTLRWQYTRRVSDDGGRE
jgi:hypothetical protein